MNEHRDILLRTTAGRIFLVFWGLVAFAVAGRIVFDLKTYLFGSAIACHGREGDYLVHLPRGFTGREPPRPLLVYLHGAGERRGSVRVLKRDGIIPFGAGTLDGDEFPFIVVSFKTALDPWQPDRVVRQLDEILAEKNVRWKIDPTRIYLTGFSMGGVGTWETAATYPDRFAAIAPLAGGCRDYEPSHFKRLPVWAFHGELDEVVSPDYSREMIDLLREERGETRSTRLTIYADREHGIARITYRNPELYRWMLRFRIEVSNDQVE